MAPERTEWTETAEKIHTETAEQTATVLNYASTATPRAGLLVEAGVLAALGFHRQ